MPRVLTGLENFITDPPPWVYGKRMGLLSNPASVDRHFTHARVLVERRLPNQLTTLFSPQHGFFAEKQDNMIESDHITDPVLKLPVFSLYGETREPSREMFENLDILLIDIQDVGTRVYTFIYTISYCLEAARRWGKKVVVLDRPNPVGGIKTEGNLLNPSFASFVGRFPIPMRHGLTIGEVALLFNHHFNIGCDLEVIPMKGWKRPMYFDDTRLPWVAPSPNLPTPASALVYPGQVIWEGTNVSEGRGTTQPFEIFGAPFIKTEKVLKFLNHEKIPGIHLRPLAFQPTSGKWQDKVCTGFQIHVTNRDTYDSYSTSLKLLQAFISGSDGKFCWKQPPYEYEHEKLPIDLIMGDSEIRARIEKMENVDEVADSWAEELAGFNETAVKFHLYR